MVVCSIPSLPSPSFEILPKHLCTSKAAVYVWAWMCVCSCLCKWMNTRVWCVRMCIYEYELSLIFSPPYKHLMSSLYVNLLTKFRNKISHRESQLTIFQYCSVQKINPIFLTLPLVLIPLAIHM